MANPPMIAVKGTKGGKQPRCTFCGKPADEVDCMVQSPYPPAHKGKPCICSECIERANEVIAAAREAEEK